MRRLSPLIVALAILAGCGDSGPTDDEQIRAQVQAFTDAMADQDQAAACDTFTPALVAHFSYETNGCNESVGPLGNPEDWRDLEVAAVDIDDDRAKVTFARVADRKQMAREEYADQLAADLDVDCLLDDECEGDDRNLPVALIDVDLQIYDGEWRIKDFDTYQP